MADQSEQVTMEDMHIELPPLMQQFIDNVKADRKQLMRTKEYQQPAQLQAFIGQFLYPRLIEMFEMLGAAGMDTYGLSVSNATQLQRLHSWTVGQLQAMGSDIDHDAPLPGVSSDVMEDFQQAFYALGVVLREKLPEDKEAESAFNKCAGLLGEMVGQLMGDDGYDDGYDDEDDDEPHERRDEGTEDPSAQAPEAPAESAEAKSEPEEEPKAQDQDDKAAPEAAPAPQEG